MRFHLCLASSPCALQKWCPRGNLTCTFFPFLTCGTALIGTCVTPCVIATRNFSVAMKKGSLFCWRGVNKRKIEKTVKRKAWLQLKTVQGKSHTLMCCNRVATLPTLQVGWIERLLSPCSVSLSLPLHKIMADLFYASSHKCLWEQRESEREGGSGR